MTITEQSKKRKNGKKRGPADDALARLAAAVNANMSEDAGSSGAGAVEKSAIIPSGNEKTKPKRQGGSGNGGNGKGTGGGEISGNIPPLPAVSQPVSGGNIVRWPGPAWWSSTMMRIAEKSGHLMREYAEKHGGKINIPSSVDPARMSQAFMELIGRMATAPDKFFDTQIAFWQDYARLCQTALARMSGQQANPVITPSPNDKRFQDAAWQDVWLFDFLKQSYLLTARWAQGLVSKVDGMDPRIARKIDFYTRQMVDAISPSNFWMTNPEVLRATVESGGENLVKGLEHLLSDLDRGGGNLAISMSDSSAFRLGENIAATPGKVVFQNNLMQLIQYAPSPQSKEVFKTPLLIIPPWINKFYILDMREKNSFIRYLVEQGHTVFCISWVNPDSSHAAVNFDDYMTQGLLAAMAEIGRITGEKRVNVTGYCIGGTLLASTLAWLKAIEGKNHPDLPPNLPEIASATYLVTLVDFSEPGDLGVFMDEEQITAIEAVMAKQGYLDAQAMATTFNMLRANDLIWSFVVNNYLLGREPFPFDLLYWNSDSTNLPAAMQSFYLRNMYLRNKLVEPDGVSMKGVPVDVRRIDTPSFLISTRDDHIAPWRTTYAATQMYKGKVTFVLSGSGHIAGVVNPPANNKYGYWTNPQCPADPEKWFEGAEAHNGSWWTEWMRWLKDYSGGAVPPRIPGSDGKAIEDAPGSYVKKKAV